MTKPAVILVGADKGGVGKTTIARAVLDYLMAHNVPLRAFDTEHPAAHCGGSIRTSPRWSICLRPPAR